MKKFLAVLSVFALCVTMLSACADNPEQNQVQTPINSENEAHKDEYIGTDAAKQKALENAGVTESDVVGLEVKLDRESAFAEYEITFDAEGYDYEYDIDAVSGEIVRVFRQLDDETKLPTPTLSDNTPSHHDETEEHHDEPSTTEHHDETEDHHEDDHHDTTAATTAEPSPAEPSYIGVESAKQIALDHAGLSASEVYDLEAELDRERGVIVYDVSFDSSGYDYDYEIDAASGEILRSDKERDNDGRSAAPAQTQQQPAAQQTDSDIGSAESERIALENAGYTADEVYGLKSERDYENGRDIYDVSFEVEGYDFDYDIDRATGEILKNKKEPDSDAPKGKRTDDSTEYISADSAKDIALNHAGFKSSDVTQLKAELDFDHGSARYEVSFKNGGYEYEYEIDAVSGNILKSEKDRD